MTIHNCQDHHAQRLPLQPDTPTFNSYSIGECIIIRRRAFKHDKTGHLKRLVLLGMFNNAKLFNKTYHKD